uniref:Uncharacterized protein n=1 Tax=Romanomermis culicivorax TaxID=13658 RepID=A0A915KRK6_ROMCU
MPSEKPPKPSAPLPPPTTPDYGFQETLDDNIDGHSSPESKALLQNPYYIILSSKLKKELLLNIPPE